MAERTATASQPGLMAFLPYVAGATWYTWWGDSLESDPAASLALLERELPIMKSVGFNSVYMGFILTWHDLQTDAANNVWNETNVAHLLSFLAKLQSYNMRAIFVLNTVGPGWVPGGIDPCSWGSDSTQTNYFYKYVNQLVRRLSTYNSMIYYLVYTEQSPTCVPYESSFYHPEQDGGSELRRINQMLKQSIGRMPRYLASDVRGQMLVGLHDNYLITEDAAYPDAPVENPNSFDFMSTVAYGPMASVYYPGRTVKSLNASELPNDLDHRVFHFRQYWPNIPMLIGETGYDTCTLNDPFNNSWTNSLMSWHISRGIGWNMWGWLPKFSFAQCSDSDQLFAFRPLLDSSELKTSMNTIQSRLLPPPLPPILMKSSYGYGGQYPMWVACDFGIAYLPCITAKVAGQPCSYTRFTPGRSTQAEFACTSQQAQQAQAGATTSCDIFNWGGNSRCMQASYRIDARIVP